MIIFIGDRPSKQMKPGAAPFEGAACEKRLKEWIEYLIGSWFITHGYIMPYEIINQCDFAYANFVAMSSRDSHILIALGNNASKALGNVEHFRLPHPSGKNRLLNNKKFVTKKLKECKNYIKQNS